MTKANTAFFEDFDQNQQLSKERVSGSLTDQLDLQQYLRILRKHKWPIVLFTALVSMLAGYYAYTATPIYSATSTLLIESQKADIISVNELVGIDNENSDYYQTQFELLKSRELALRVVRHLRLLNNPYYSPLPALADSRNPSAFGGISTDTSLADPTGGQAENPSDTNGFSIESIKSSVSGLVSRFTTTASSASEAEGGTAADDTENGGTIVLNTETGSIEQASGSAEKIGPIVYPELDLSQFSPVEIESAERQAVGNFLGGLSINPIRRTKLVKISYQSPDPAFAAEAANAIGEQYIVAYLDARLELTTQASTWLSGKLQDLKKKLDVSERKLLAFKEQNDLVDVDGSVGRLNERELFFATEELARARGDLSDAADLRSQVRRFRGNTQLLESLPIFQADQVVRELKIETGQRQRELDELLNRYGDRHPRIVDARSRLDSIQNTLNTNVARIVETVENEFRLSSQRVAALESSLNQGKREIQDLGSKQFELEAIEREVQTNRDLYNTFFTRMTEADSAEGLEAANARVTEYAIASGRPIKPKKSLIIALAALGSLVLSMLMAFLYETMDETIRGTEDIEDKLGVKMLGILPMMKTGLIGRKELPLNPLKIKDKKGTFFEAVNTVRTAICLDDTAEKRRQVILVTSSIPGEGKSTTSLNLAYSLSQMERVLLIDCDMRRPSIAKAIDLEKDSLGLSSLITRTSSPRECVRVGVIDRLDIITSGPMPEQPLEMLSSARFETLLEQLRTVYDRIILDCAPTQAVSDALVLSRLSDAVVYAVKSHSTGYPLIRRGIERLRQVGAPLAGVLVTQVDIEKISSYGGDYYYQGYYDYYGYNEKGKGKIKMSPLELEKIRGDNSVYDISGIQNSDVSYQVNEFSDALDGDSVNGSRHMFVQRSAAAEAGNDHMVSNGQQQHNGGVRSASTQQKPLKTGVENRRNIFGDDLDLL